MNKSKFGIIGIIFMIMSISVASAELVEVKREIISSDYPGFFAGLGDKTVRITYADGSIAIVEERSVLTTLSLNQYGGRIIYISGSYGGRCGSGTSNSFTITTDDGVRLNSGTVQVSCSVPDPNEWFTNFLLGQAGATEKDTIYINGYLYQSGAGSIAPTPTPPTTTTPPKVTIIPPSISRLWDVIWSGIKGLFGLSIIGGQSVLATVNQQYSTTLSLPFAVPDTVQTDGTYQAKFGEWLIVDSKGNILKESGWSNELTAPPYTATVIFTPTTAGKYYIVGVIDSQQYIWNGAKWTMTESVETKEIQEINAQLPGVTTQVPRISFSEIWTWILGLFGIR